MDGGGEGAYAKKDIPTGTVVAYYNGIKMKAGEKSPYDETGYAIFIGENKKNLFGCKTGEHMDIPPKVRYYGTWVHGSCD